MIYKQLLIHLEEYFYWVMTSILGAQENRLGEIEQEWKLSTKAKV